MTQSCNHYTNVFGRCSGPNNCKRFTFFDAGIDCASSFFFYDDVSNDVTGEADIVDAVVANDDDDSSDVEGVKTVESEEDLDIDGVGVEAMGDVLREALKEEDADTVEIVRLKLLAVETGLLAVETGLLCVGVILIV